MSNQNDQNKTYILEFRKTNDWWVDFGLVCLHEFIKDEYKDEYLSLGIEFFPLSSDSLNSFYLKGEKEKIEEYLLYIKDNILSNEYFIYKSGNKGIFIDPESNEPKVYDKLAPLLHLKKFFGAIPPMPKGKIKWKDLTLKQRETIISLCKKEEISYPKKDDADDKIFVGEPVYNISWEPDLDTGKKTCYFSGQKFNKLVEVKGYYYPALVDPSKMQTFYSSHSGKIQMGSPYALAALLSPSKIKYVFLSRKGETLEYLYFVPIAQTLYELMQAQYGWVPNALEIDPSQQKNSNFEKFGIYGELPAENIIPYVLAVYDRANVSKLASEYDETEFSYDGQYNESGITVMAFTDSMMTEIRGFNDYFKIIDDILNNISRSDLNNFFRTLAILKEKKNEVLNSHGRNEISRAFLDLRPFGNELEILMFENTRNINHAWDVYKVYTEVIGKMKPEELEKCGKIGSIIGMAATNRGSIGTIYDFRNARTKAQFLNALEKFQFILGSHKDDAKCFNDDLLKEFLELFNTSPDWREMKSAVVIKAVNLFKSAEYAKSKSQGEK